MDGRDTPVRKPGIEDFTLKTPLFNSMMATTFQKGDFVIPPGHGSFHAKTLSDHGLEVG